MNGTKPLATVRIFNDRREGVNQGKKKALRSGLRAGAFAAGMVAAAVGLTAAAEAPKAASTDRAQPWHVRLSRPQLLAAWTRLKSLPVPGVPVDMRFNISGAAFHVSPTGDDGAEGSRDKPWRTLQHAVSQLRPNTVIYLDAGTYYGPVVVQMQASADAPAAIRAAEDQQVVVTYPDEFVAAEKAKVHSAPTEGRTRAMDEKGQELHYPPLFDVRGRFIEISGLHLIGARDRLPQNLYSENGASFSGKGGEGCRVLYNEIENVGHCGVKEMGHGGHSILIEGNLIHDVGQTHHDHGIYAPADDITVRKNLLLNATGYGLHAYSTPKRIVATHNIAAGNDHFGMILGGPEALVAHNVFGSNHWGGLFFFRSGCKGCVVKNNIFYDDPAVDFDQMGDAKQAPSGNVFDHNCLVPGVRLEKMSPQDTVGSKNVQVNPMVIDARSFDFRLGRRSPCLNAGGDVGLEFLGKAPDIGLSESR